MITTDSALTITRATVDDLPLCAPFGQAFHEEMKLSGTFIPEVFVRNWTFYLGHYPADILLLKKHGELIGGLGVLLAPDQYDSQPVATEFFWFVGKEHRSGTGAFRLIKAFEAWGAEHHATKCRLVHILGQDETPRESALARIYRKLGYRPIEVAWEKSLTKREV